MLSLERIFQLAKQQRASDIHLVRGIPPRCRIDGVLSDLDDTPLDEYDCEAYARELAGDDYEKIRTIGELDTARSIYGTRTRMSIFRQMGTVSCAVRLLEDRIPTPEELRLPQVVQDLVRCHSGLVLVTGEAGSGKTTTIASVIDLINHNVGHHIITMEEPVEYIFKPDRSIINQREIGTDTESYSAALRSALREDPNVIFIGEMRDQDTIRAALTAAETGHLVFSTLHTGSAAETVDRVVGSFSEGEQRQIRTQLAGALRMVISQQLLPRMSCTGRIAAFEVMVVNQAIRNLIREGKTTQIDSFIGLGSQEGSVSMDVSLQRLVRDLEISREVAVAYARDPEHFAKR